MTSHSLKVLMPPSVLVEVARISRTDARQRKIRALARGPWKRLPSEAETEAADIVAEMRRLRPHWMRRMPDTGKVASLNNFWTNKIWREAAQDSQRIHDYEMARTDERDYLVSQQKQNRANIVLRDKLSLRPLTALTISKGDAAKDLDVPGWNGAPVEAWRWESATLFWHQLVTVVDWSLLNSGDTTFADWIGAYANLTAVRSDQAEFNRFWLTDAERDALPREWLRWAVRTVQLTRKVTNGNPADEQHSAYLVDCDLFLTADRSFCEVLEIVREDAPFPIAEPRLVSGDDAVPALDRLAAVL